LKPKLTTEASCGASRLTTCRVDVTGAKPSADATVTFMLYASAKPPL